MSMIPLWPGDDGRMPSAPPFLVQPKSPRLWLRNGILTLVLAGSGAVLLVLSFFVGTAGPQDFHPEPSAPSIEGLYPDVTVALIGWLALAAGLAHLWFPRRFVPRDLRLPRDTAPTTNPGRTR